MLDLKNRVTITLARILQMEPSPLEKFINHSMKYIPTQALGIKVQYRMHETIEPQVMCRVIVMDLINPTTC